MQAIQKTLKFLVLGITFKENVSDIRNSKVIDMVKDLMEYGVQVDIMDCCADAEEVKQQHNLVISEKTDIGYDVVILAVVHDAYKHFQEEDILNLCNPDALFADLKGYYRNRFSKLAYWNL